MQMLGLTRCSLSRTLSFAARSTTCAAARLVARGPVESTWTTVSTCRKLAPPRHPNPFVLAMTGGCAVVATAVLADRPQCAKHKTCFDVTDLWDQVGKKDAQARRRALFIFWQNEPRCGVTWMSEFFREFAPEAQCVTKSSVEQKQRMWQLLDEEITKFPPLPGEREGDARPALMARAWNSSLNVNDPKSRAASPLVPHQHSQLPLATVAPCSGGACHGGGACLGGGGSLGGSSSGSIAPAQPKKAIITKDATDNRTMRMMMVLNDETVQDYVDRCLTGAIGINEMVPPTPPHPGFRRAPTPLPSRHAELGDRSEVHGRRHMVEGRAVLPAPLRRDQGVRQPVGARS